MKTDLFIQFIFSSFYKIRKVKRPMPLRRHSNIENTLKQCRNDFKATSSSKFVRFFLNFVDFVLDFDFHFTSTLTSMRKPFLTG